MKTTPSPWEWQDVTAGREIALCGADKDRTFVLRTHYKMREADKRLIAAAPTMLAALKRFATDECTCHDYEPKSKLVCNACEARAAIKRAEGGTA